MAPSATVNGVNGAPHTNGTLKEPSGKPRHRNPSSYAAKFDLADHFIGGNHLEAAPPGSVKDFVLEGDGHTVITNVGGEKDIWENFAEDFQGPHSQQRYRSRERDKICAKMGLRNVRRRAGHSIYGHGHTGRFTSKRRLYSHGRSIC